MSGRPAPELADGVLVVGAGLIGTSVALALSRQGVSVHVVDQDPGRARLAADLGAGIAELPRHEPSLVVAAVPVGQVQVVVSELSRRYLSSTFTDVASVKSHVQAEIESQGDLALRFVGGHPMSGRERSGAAVADPALFEGRPWVLTPGARTQQGALRRAEALVDACGADLVVTSAARHDTAVALVSHAPQLLASVLAARLADADGDLVALAGPGIRDVTRIAESDPDLWTGILSANAPAVLEVLDQVALDLDAARAALRDLALQQDRAARPTDTIHALLEQGVRGRRRLPGKHGGRAATYATLQVLVSDQPGQLARLFTAADEVAVNIEDVTIEHAPGHPVGVVELMVAPDHAESLATALGERGWTVHL